MELKPICVGKGAAKPFPGESVPCFLHRATLGRNLLGAWNYTGCAFYSSCLSLNVLSLKCNF